MCPQMSGSARVWANRYRPRHITRAITASEAGAARSSPRAGPAVTAADPAKSEVGKVEPTSYRGVFGVDLPNRPRYRKNPPTSRITPMNQELWGTHPLDTRGKRTEIMP